MTRLLASLTISLTLTACRGPDSGLPEAYRGIEVPAARLASPEARARGKALFAANCVLCHGERGDGRGLRASGFAKPPANFTDPVWRRGATPRRVFFAIREGVHGTPMPSWKWLGEGQIWDLVAYVLSIGATTEPEPTPSPRVTDRRLSPVARQRQALRSHRA
jgi:mono/diheme cytochrome c family protein